MREQEGVVEISGLQYVGRNPDSDSSVVHKSYADTTGASLAVTTDYVNGVIAQQAQYLASPSYVDSGDALRAHKFDVDAADSNYVSETELGQPDGVATLDSFGNLTAEQVPADAVTDRPALYYDITQGTVYLAQGSTHTVISTQTREYRIASITVPDPGYPWYPLCFGIVQGLAGGADNGRGHENGNHGRLTVQPPQGVSDTIYASGIGLSEVHTNFHIVLPYAGKTSPPTTPLNHPHVNGSLQLDLYGSCLRGTSYIWSGTGLSYYIIVFPAL